MYRRFGLTLMVTHSCNMRCAYCYLSAREGRMARSAGERAIERAVGSIERGGMLELGFFGGEPFLEAGLIGSLIEFAAKETEKSGVGLMIAITTNGTVLNDEVLSIMERPGVEISVSIDGRRGTHDRNRCFVNGQGSYDVVCRHIGELLERGLSFRAASVVGPGWVNELDEEIVHLRQMGCRDIELSLDLWSSWDDRAMEQLKDSIYRCAKLWLEGLPENRVNWFDDKAARLSDMVDEPGMCGYGKGDIPVAPSGRLYPCERLIGGDEAANPMRLAGDLFGGEDFDFGPRDDIRNAKACSGCGMKAFCNTTCGCCQRKISRAERL